MTVVHQSARQFLATVVARYRQLLRYRDSGQVLTRLPGGDFPIDFTTSLAEDGAFRFTFERPHPYPPLRHKISQHLVQRVDGRASLVSTAAGAPSRPGFEGDLSMVIAAATGISGGAAHTIGELLFAEVDGWSITSLARPRFRRWKQVDGVLCHRVSGLHPRTGERVTLFVGVHDGLMRRRIEHRQHSVETRQPVDAWPASWPIE
jgi:hypothetical protein